MKTGNIAGFIKRLQVFLSECPYEMAKDIKLRYQNVLFIVFRLAGLYTLEYHTSYDRVDLILKTADYVDVVEFKLDGSVEEVM